MSEQHPANRHAVGGENRDLGRCAITITLGLDVACKTDHQASLADAAGRILWSGHRFRTTCRDLERLWSRLQSHPDPGSVTVVMEPSRNAWVPLAAWFRRRGARVVLVPPEQSSDLRDYLNKHTKSDRLDSRVLARLPVLHPEGLRAHDGLGPGEGLKRAVRLRANLVERRTAVLSRLDALLELLGPGWAEVLGGDPTKSSLALLERYADPHLLKRLGSARLARFLIRTSRGQWREDKAAALLAAAEETLQLWGPDGLDFGELAEDIAVEARLAQQLSREISQLDDRIAALYAHADPERIFASGPGIGPTLAATLLGRLGDPTRFASLAGVRAFTGLVPSLDQSGLHHRHGPPTKAGDAYLRQAIFLAADHARRVDPGLAARYHRLMVDNGKHHISATCTIAGALITRLAACWRRGERYVLRDVDGTEITPEQGRMICRERYRLTDAQRDRHRQIRTSQRLKHGTSRRHQESHSAPATGPSLPTLRRSADRPRALDSR